MKAARSDDLLKVARASAGSQERHRAEDARYAAWRRSISAPMRASLYDSLMESGAHESLPGRGDDLDDLLLGGGPANLEVRRVADLIDPRNRRWAAGDVGTLTSIADRVLYTARRDVLPAVEVNGLLWRADLVRYEPGILPTRELHRSMGHWNAPTQYELFQAMTGKVVMIMGEGSHSAVWGMYLPGELAHVRMGWWHITYVVEGPSFVFNVYADTGSNASKDKFARDDVLPCWVCAESQGWDVRSEDQRTLEPASAPAATTRALRNRRSLMAAFADRDERLFDAIAHDCRSA